MRHILLIAALACLIACGSESDPVKVSGRSWTVTEAHLLAHDFIARCADRAEWPTAFVHENLRRPVLRVRGLVNETSEAFDETLLIEMITESFADNITIAIESAEVSADFMLSGTLALHIEPTVNDAGYGMVKRYIAELEVVEVPSGRPVCTATGDLAFVVDDFDGIDDAE